VRSESFKGLRRLEYARLDRPVTENVRSHKHSTLRASGSDPRSVEREEKKVNLGDLRKNIALEASEPATKTTTPVIASPGEHFAEGPSRKAA